MTETTAPKKAPAKKPAAPKPKPIDTGSPLTVEESITLLSLLLGGDEPPVLVGQTGTQSHAPWCVAVEDQMTKRVGKRAVSPQTVPLLKKYAGVE